jgi:hypothetical protein
VVLVIRHEPSSRTRVAGWEEPRHPGSACIAHNNPQPPTLQPISRPASHTARATYHGRQVARGSWGLPVRAVDRYLHVPLQNL